MSEQDQQQQRTERLAITELTAEIVGAYVAHHTVATNDLPLLIASVSKELVGLGHSPEEPKEEKPSPAVSIKRSVKPAEFICLLCGKPQKMLKRHLVTRHELTPSDYKAMFGLKDGYPLVAPVFLVHEILGVRPLIEKVGRGTDSQGRMDLTDIVTGGA